jgi:nucleotide-binding universal stress UspA family protein
MMESASVFADANRKMEEHTKEVLRAYVALAQKDYGIECRGHVVCGENAKEMVVQYIVDHAIQDVYVGTRDVGAFKRFFLGSFSTHVSTHAPCNVVIVRHRAAEAKK